MCARKVIPHRIEMSHPSSKKPFSKINVYFLGKKACLKKGSSGLVRKNVIMGCIHQPRRQVPFIWKEVVVPVVQSRAHVCLRGQI